MTPYEYALHNWDITLKQAAEICKDFDEAILLNGCLISKRGYSNAISSLIRCGEYSKERWLDSARTWGQWYLSELKRLEELQ